MQMLFFIGMNLLLLLEIQFLLLLKYDDKLLYFLKNLVFRSIVVWYAYNNIYLSSFLKVGVDDRIPSVMPIPLKLLFDRETSGKPLLPQLCRLEAIQVLKPTKLKRASQREKLDYIILK